jgi:tetratricopeptide (TPR) repeat protein
MNDASNQIYREMSDLIRQGQAENAVSRLRVWLESKPEDEVGLSLLGSALMRCRKMEDALEVFSRAVKSNPRSFGAHGDLAFAQMQAGNSMPAVQAFEAAVELNPDFYQGWCFLSKLQFANGDFETARRSIANAERCDPFAQEFPKIQAAMSAKKFAEAEKIARTVLSRQSGYPKAAYALAHLATQVGAHEEATKILEKSIESYPCDVNLRAALVRSLEETGHYERAIGEAEQIALLDPGAFAPWLMIGRAHGNCAQYEECLAAYDKALMLASEDKEETGNIQLVRGHVLKILGQYEDSISAYRESIELVEHNGAGWWGLADMKTHRFSDDDITTMQQLAENKEAKPELRTQAAFAFGKSLEDAGQYADAFAWYRKANDLRTGISFDPATNREGIDTLISTFTDSLPDAVTPTATESPTPIFILGLPRSGSTLVEQILASHSQIEGTMELVNLPNVVRLITIDGGKHKLSYPESLWNFEREELLAYGKSYLDSTAVYRTDKPFFIDKLPTNFDKIGLLQLILPQAIIIDARRHPLDCGLSCFKQHFASGHQFSYSLPNIGHYYNDYLRLMDHWDSVLPQKVFCVQYEKMISNTEEMTRKLLEHCGVDFEDSCLRFFENKRAVRTASSEQVRQPIYDNSVRYWKNFETELQPLIDTLGEDTLARFENL